MTAESSSGGAGGHGGLRAATGDRERTIDVLKTAFAEGRLTSSELEARAGQAYQSVTHADLAELTVDLPVGPAGTVVPGGGQPRERRLAAPGSRHPDALALSALICALLPGIPSLAAIPMGLAARRRKAATGQPGGIATAAITVGSAQLLLFIVLLAAHIIHT